MVDGDGLGASKRRIDHVYQVNDNANSVKYLHFFYSQAFEREEQITNTHAPRSALWRLIKMLMVGEHW